MKRITGNMIRQVPVAGYLIGNVKLSYNLLWQIFLWFFTLMSNMAFFFFWGGGRGLRMETTQVFELGLGADIHSCTSDEDHYIYHDNRTVQHIYHEDHKSDKAQNVAVWCILIHHR